MLKAWVSRSLPRRFCAVVNAPPTRRSQRFGPVIDLGEVGRGRCTANDQLGDKTGPGVWWTFFGGRTRRTPAAQPTPTTPARNGPRGAWQPEHPRR